MRNADAAYSTALPYYIGRCAHRLLAANAFQTNKRLCNA